MRSLVSTIIAVILFGTSVAEDHAFDLYQGCWKSNLPDDGITNSIAFCIDGESVEAVVFYPNRGDPPTTCRSKGRIEPTDAGLLLVRTRRGTCENAPGPGGVFRVRICLDLALLRPNKALHCNSWLFVAFLAFVSRPPDTGRKLA